jgi:hypothetical protein
LAIDIGREAIELIRQNWKVISIPNTLALGLAFFGVLGPGATTVLSNGSAVVAAANALRPLLDRPMGRPSHRRATIIRFNAKSTADCTITSEIFPPKPFAGSAVSAGNGDVKQLRSFSVSKMA